GDWLEYLHLREDEDELKDDINVLYEDDRIIAISKPDFLPVTPTSKYYFNSLAILIKERYNVDFSPVHRLDIETSGVLLFGKDKKARNPIQKLFRDHKVEKQYQAVTFNSPDTDSISGNLVPDEGSKIYTKLMLVAAEQANSLTLIIRQEPWGIYSRVWVQPITGKTNQIRAHLAAIGCPIVGDKKYYPDEDVFLDWFTYRDINRILPELKLNRQALHCESLSFINPFSGLKTTIIDQTSSWEKKISVLLLN
ncbi:RluA family pseudouridine synthase, partial [bacterium]|nr:RluA family pseudouridine synthase [bacterium]